MSLFSLKTRAKPQLSKREFSTPNDAMEGDKKMKVAMLIGFKGTGYYGFVKQPTAIWSTKTIFPSIFLTIFSAIEDEMFKAMKECKVMENQDNASNIRWTRSSRTDKGVRTQ